MNNCAPAVQIKKQYIDRTFFPLHLLGVSPSVVISTVYVVQTYFC